MLLFLKYKGTIPGKMKLTLKCMLVFILFSGVALSESRVRTYRLPRISRLVLVNAVDNKPIEVLRDNQELNLASVPSRKLNIRADCEGKDPHEVRFMVNGFRWFRIEKSEPFALAGDEGGDYNAWTPRLGALNIVAVGYGKNGLPATKPYQITLNVVDSAREASIITEPQEDRVAVTLSLDDPKFEVGSCLGNFNQQNSNISLSCSHYLKGFQSMHIESPQFATQTSPKCVCEKSLVRHAAPGEDTLSCSCDLPKVHSKLKAEGELQLVILGSDSDLPLARGEVIFAPIG